MAVINPPGYIHNLSTHTAQTDRLADSALLVPDAVGSLRPRGGLRMSTDLQVTALGTPNMSVNLSAGGCWVPQGQSALGGAYNVNNDGTLNLAIAAANASLGRNDLVVARVRDQFYTGTQNVASFEIITGTAASTPTDPVLPTDSSFLTIARVNVPAGATSIVAGNITMLANTAPVLTGNPVSATDTTAGLYVGQTRDHPTNGLERWDGGKWTTANPFTWQDLLRSTTYNYSVPVGAAYADIANGNYTVNGLPVGREVDFEWKVPQCAIPAGSNLNLRMLLASTNTADSLQYSTGSAASYSPGRMSGSIVVPTGGSVLVQIQGYATANAVPLQAGNGTNAACVLRYRVR